MNIIGVVGSLRKGSYNRAVMEAAKELAPAGTTIEIVDIGNLPLFNQDVEAAAFPAEAQALKDKVKAADGVLIATPEYNRSIPGVLKNAIDWMSRPYGQSAWAAKPVLVLGATPGMVGTAIAQEHLKNILLYLDARVMGQPELYIGGITEKLDASGKLTDQATRDHLAKAIAVFVTFADDN
jgi:chromate reductase